MAAKGKKPGEKTEEILIESISTLELENVCLIGTSPLLMNRLAEKARRELLMPSPQKSRSEKQSHLKHDPYVEYRSSVYQTVDDHEPLTRLVFPGGAFRKAIATAALDVPGSSKAQIGRLVRVVEDNVSIYGVPEMDLRIVRQAGMNKTPDVRTRAIIPLWCCQLTIRFAHPLLKEKGVMALLAAAGDFVGVGDGRNEKGSSLSCGCFQIVAPDNKEFLRIKATGGIEAQDAALENPKMHNAETAELMEWFDMEVVKRDFKKAKSPAANGKKGKEVVS